MVTAQRVQARALEVLELFAEAAGGALPGLKRQFGDQPCVFGFRRERQGRDPLLRTLYHRAWRKANAEARRRYGQAWYTRNRERLHGKARERSAAAQAAREARRAALPPCACGAPIQASGRRGVFAARCKVCRRGTAEHAAQRAETMRRAHCRRCGVAVIAAGDVPRAAPRPGPVRRYCGVKCRERAKADRRKQAGVRT